MYEIFYTGDGTTNEFVFDFPYFQDKDIQVSVNSEILDADAHSVVPAFDTRQDGMFSGGRVILANTPNVGAEIRIWRKIDLSRTVDYQALSVLDPEEINADITFLLEYLRDALAWNDRLENIENAMHFLESIQSQIEELGTFNELARKNELPDLTRYALVEDIPDVSNFAPANHSHDEYATNDDLTALDARVDTLENTETVLPENYDYVVEFQKPMLSNNYTWYRKYKSGWVEQGGTIDKGSNVRDISSMITLPIEMADIFYSVSLSGYNTSAGPTSMCIGSSHRSSTGFFAYCYGFGTGDTGRYLVWKISGFAA